ncbi:MAG TPA: phosphatidylglycerol lysyltransferase domain-containing protein [Terriglobales bacterium]|nr:phosphatidylglycerol lysyltransferase domain-containing protein [Terriglobales bacterium]
MKSRPISVRLVTLITLGSGILNVVSVVNRTLPHRWAILTDLFSLEFIHLTRSLTLLSGFVLIISSFNIYKRKKRAFQLVFLLSTLSIFFHLTKGLNYEEAIVSLAVAIILFFSRKYFTVKSSILTLRWGLINLVTAFILTLAYGIAGFWLLDTRDFGIQFHVDDAIRETLKFMTFVDDPSLVPHTRYAIWFLHSLDLITTLLVIYALYSIFRPMIYKFRSQRRERMLVREYIEKHGRSALDFFKSWPDKSYFFSPSQNSFIAYRVGNNFALALGDPVGPEEEIEDIIKRFVDFCDENDWGIGFHQTLPDFLPAYEQLGFRKLKIGEDAIVNLMNFNLAGNERKALRQGVHRIESHGVHILHFEPPISDDVLSKAKEVSDAWLRLPGRKERQFTLGTFDPEYVRSTPLFVAADSAGKFMAFMNEIPSYHKDEATIDLMRFRSDAPGGVMDFLFVKLFFHLKERGFHRFNLGMSPMSGFREHETPSAEEKLIHFFFQQLGFIFRYKGLKQYKAKFASFWEPRYAIYQSPLDLPRMALALRKVSAVKWQKEEDTDVFEPDSDVGIPEN